MPITTTHPQYDEMLDVWQTVEDCLSSDKIKAKGVRYLPKTGGQAFFEVKHPDVESPYKIYRLRARFPELVGPSVRALVGVAHRAAAVVEVPDRIDIDQITPDMADLEELSRRCTRQVTLKGRHGLLVDVDGDGKPYIASYPADSIINWKSQFIDGRKQLTLVVLKESVNVSDDEYGHDTEPRYRKLSLVDGLYFNELYNGDGELVSDAEPTKADSERLGFIPFVALGSIDTTIDVDESPMIPVARSAITIYQLDADQRQAMHYSAIPTPVVIGNTAEDINTIGAPIIWKLEQGGDAKFLESSGKSIEDHRKEKLEEYERAAKHSAEIARQTGQESGEALSLRMFSQHATLYSVVNSCGVGIKQCLQWSAEIIGADPDQVQYEPNSDFTENMISEALITALDRSVNSGNTPKEVLWNAFRDGGLTDMTNDEIAGAIDNSGALI